MITSDTQVAFISWIVTLIEASEKEMDVNVKSC